MAGEIYNGAGSIHAVLARLTKLNSDGSPATGADNVLWSDSLVKLALGLNLNEPDATKQVNGAGLTCMVFQPPKTIDSLNVDSFAWCTPDPLIAEFLAGGDIISDASHEVQTLSTSGTATGGSFTLTHGGHTTGAIAWNTTAAAAQTAINAALGSGAVKVTGGPFPATPLIVTFRGQTNVAAFTHADSLTGTGSPAVSVATTAEGAATGGTNAIGYAAPGVGTAPKPNGVAVELWSRAIAGGSQVGFMHWLFPRLALVLGSDGFEFNATDPLTPTYTGSGAENSNFGAGADASWTYISNRVFQWVLEDDLPSYTNGLATVT